MSEQQDLKFSTSGDVMKEYSPKEMIDQINEDNKSLEEHIRITKSNPYEVNKATQNPTGGETWQTKATAKGAVPRYMSPSEHASMRLDKLEQSLLRLAKDLRGRMDTLESRLHALEQK